MFWNGWGCSTSFLKYLLIITLWNHIRGILLSHFVEFSNYQIYTPAFPLQSKADVGAVCEGFQGTQSCVFSGHSALHNEHDSRWRGPITSSAAVSWTERHLFCRQTLPYKQLVLDNLNSCWPVSVCERVIAFKGFIGLFLVVSWQVHPLPGEQRKACLSGIHHPQSDSSLQDQRRVVEVFSHFAGETWNVHSPGRQRLWHSYPVLSICCWRLEKGSFRPWQISLIWCC